MTPRWLLLALPLSTACATTSLASREADDPWASEMSPRPLIVVDREERTPIAREYIYFGGHPIPDEAGGGWCTLDGAHPHPYLPAAEQQFVARSGGFAFRDDLTEWAYADAHPVPDAHGVRGPARVRPRPNRSPNSPRRSSPPTRAPRC